MTAVSTVRQTVLVRQFVDISIDDIGSVGGKNASLGEMYRELTQHGVKVPDGFAVTADAYRQFLLHNKLDREIRVALDDLDTCDVAELSRRGRLVREAILSAELPPELRRAVSEAYQQLPGENGSPADVAVRSSATAEDLPDASFADNRNPTLTFRARLHCCIR